MMSGAHGAFRITRHGGPEVLEWIPGHTGKPGAGEVLLAQEASGINFIDIYQRAGLYKLPLPHGIGNEGAGVVQEVGEGVDFLKPGDVVAYAGGPPGSYATARLYPAGRLVKLPDGVDTETAAAIMLKGMTVEYLIRRTYPVKPGDTVLLHAAAGGVGLLACQWLRHLGAIVIGTVGSEGKAALAKTHGASHTIVYTKEPVAEIVHSIAPDGVDVVFDSVGKDTFQASLDSLKPRGTMVSFGNASGVVPPIDIATLAKNAIYLTRPSLQYYTATRTDLEASAQALFEVVLGGQVKVTNLTRFALRDAAKAQEAVASRETTGSVVLLP